MLFVSSFSFSLFLLLGCLRIHVPPYNTHGAKVLGAPAYCILFAPDRSWTEVFQIRNERLFRFKVQTAVPIVGFPQHPLPCFSLRVGRTMSLPSPSDYLLRSPCQMAVLLGFVIVAQRSQWIVVCVCQTGASMAHIDRRAVRFYGDAHAVRTSIPVPSCPYPDDRVWGRACHDVRLRGGAPCGCSPDSMVAEVRYEVKPSTLTLYSSSRTSQTWCVDAMEKMLFIQHVSLVRVVCTTSLLWQCLPAWMGIVCWKSRTILVIFVRAGWLPRGSFIVGSLDLSSWNPR
jgi:hypothetical protein